MQPVFLETKVKEQMKNDNSKFELARMQNVPQILKVLYVHEKKKPTVHSDTTKWSNFISQKYGPKFEA